MPTKLLPRKPTDPNPRNTHAPGGQYPGREDWRALHKEPVIDPERPIIDPHHHMWDRNGNRYLIHEFLADARTGHNIRASVFVECGSFYRKGVPPLMAPLGEVEFANGIAAMAPAAAMVT